MLKIGFNSKNQLFLFITHQNVLENVIKQVEGMHTYDHIISHFLQQWPTSAF